jgi:hypothetical protein
VPNQQASRGEALQAAWQIREVRHAWSEASLRSPIGCVLYPNHRSVAQVDADAALAADTLSRKPDEIPREGLGARIAALHRAYPEWGATRIAQAVGCNDAYVRAVSRRHHLDLPRSDQGAFPSAGRDYMRAKRDGS